jgi:hypothetical protein
LLTLSPGDAVLVCGESSWAEAVVVDVRPVSELPAIDGAPDPALVAEVLAEGNCTAVAVVSFEDRWVTKVFAAFLVNGVWRDLRGRFLTIVKRNQAA